MDYEKKYKEALGRAREWYNKTEPDSYTCIVESIFPELKESEDEMAKKGIINTIERYIEHVVNDKNYAPDAKDFLVKELKGQIAWLEKQKEIDKASYEIAEKEKDDFVSGQFIECRKSFNEFKENNSYWFEYVGNDTYIGRSDNILNKKFHITPRQLYRLFTQQHCPKEKFDFDKKELKKVEPKFNIGDTIKYVGERKELAADKYTIKEICNDCYITTYNNKIPFRMQEYYAIVNDTKELKKFETSLPSFDEQQGTPFIEIPFGAKDSELQEASYHIPEGFYAEIQGDKVVIKKGEKKSSWSEEDEEKATKLKEFITQCKGFNKANREKAFNMIDALKPKSHWKPSDKQIRALRWVLNNVPYNTYKEEISGLLEQIKDL